MTIVASNNLTIGNVNDGTITHSAFAYNADGSDRFTTVYPNLNLLDIKSNVVFGQYQNWSTAILDNNAYRATSAYISVTPGVTYSLSSDWSKTTWISIFAYQDKSPEKAKSIYDGSVGNWFDLSTAGRFVTKNTTITIPQGINFVRISFFSADTTKPLALKSLLDSKPKFEPGQISTPWMPSKSEVKPSDYPSYRGEYSDKLITQSQLPSDYKWMAFQGPTGQTGDKGDPTGVTKQETEPASSQRFIGMLWQYTGTSSISITGTTATPNATYRWIGTAWELWYFYAVNIKADTISAISGNLGTMVAGVIKVIADIVVNAANKTKKFGMLFTKKGLLSSGPSYKADSTVSDTKMAVASLTQGELRFINTNYNDDLEQVQDIGTSSSNTGFMRFSSNENGDLLEITSSGRILLNGLTTQTSPWIEASSFAKYRVAFGTVTVSVGVINGGISANIYLGHMPDGLRPLDSRMLYAPAWYADNSRDRHFQIDIDNGNMGIVNPFPGQEYRFEVVWSIPY